MLSSPTPTLVRCALGLCLAVALSACGQAPLIVEATTDIPPVQIMEHDLFQQSEVFQGDARITTTDELEQLLGYTRITGNLTIAAPILKEVVWPTLRRVDGFLWIWKNQELEYFDLSGLQQVGGMLLIRENNRLTDFDLSGLAHIGGGLSVVYNDTLSDCRVDELRNTIGEGNITEGVTATDNLPQPGCGDDKL